MGEDPNRDGLLRTPERMEKSMQFLTRGYAMDATEVLQRRCSTSITTRW